jgi:hypothetical protein
MSASDTTIVTVKVPFAMRRRGGRKLVLAPDGEPMPPAAPQVESTLIKAIARAFRWQSMLEVGRYSTIKEIAKAEKINPSYVSRILRLTLLDPKLVENIVLGKESNTPALDDLMKPFPAWWQMQAGAFGSTIATRDR